jgi:5-(carboxyamino)imidazole ribonucleotide synthase
MGYKVAVLEPSADCPAGQVASAWSTPATATPPASTRWPRNALAVTTEFENVPADSLSRLAQQVFVAPERARRVGGAGPHCRETFLRRLRAKSGVMPAPHKVIASQADIDAIGDDLLPGILKTVRMGYDGKGQVRVRRATTCAPPSNPWAR